MSLPLPVADLVDEFNVGPLTLNRPAASTKDAFGTWQDGAETPIVIDPVAVHTVTGRDLEQLAEADRQRETVQVYARVELKNRDRIVYQGRSFRLTQAQDYQKQGAVWIALGQLVEDA